MEAAMAAAAAGGASAGKQRNFACVECFRLRRKCEWQDEQCCKRCAAKGLVCHARQTMYRRKVRPRSDLFPHDALQISPPETLQPWHRLVPHAPSVQHQHRDAHAPYPEPPSQAHAHAQAQAQPRPHPQLQQLQLQLQHQQHALNVADHRQTTKQRDGQLDGAPHDDLLDEPQHLQDRFCQPALLDVSTMVTDRAPSQRGADKMGAPSLADGVDVGVAKPGSIAVPDLDLDLGLDLELELDLLPTYSNIYKLVRESRAQGFSAQSPALRMLALGFLSAVRQTGSAVYEQAGAVTLASAMGLEPSPFLRMPFDVPLDVVQGLTLELEQGHQCATVVTIVNSVRTVRATGLFAKLFWRAGAGPPHGPLSDAWGAIIDTPHASRQLTGAVVNDMLRLTDQHWRGQPPRLHWETELLDPVCVRCTEGHAFQARLHVEAVLALGGQVHLWHLCVTDIKPLSPGAAPRLRALAAERVGPGYNDLDFDQLRVEGHGRLARRHSLKLSMKRERE